ncbi:helix-turn-helix transcriptional regulator [Leminorella grimontii]
MKTFADRLNAAIKESGHSQASLANAVGVSAPGIWKLTNGKSTSTRKLVEIAKVLGVEPEWLSTGNGPKNSIVKKQSKEASVPPESEWMPISVWDKNTPLEDDEVEVPFLKDIEFACGDGRVNEGDYNGFMLRFSKATLRRVGANTDGSGVICFPATGDSMEPVLPDGTTVAVNTNSKRVVDGKMYAINHLGLKRIKLLYLMPNNILGIRSYNKADFPDQEVPMDDVEIIGRVFWYSVLI